MRVAGFREFRSHASAFMKGDEIVFITSHGRLSSLLVPMLRPEDLPDELRRKLLQRLGSAVRSHLRRRGLTESRVMRDFEKWRKERRGRRGGR